jgi:hypothetical protein
MADQIFHNGELDHEYNYDNLFVRGVSVALGKTMTKVIRWINHFEDKKIRVLVPFYYQFIQEQFVVDTFVDDVYGKRVTLDTTQRPRGIIRLKSWAPISSEFANPNQYLASKSNINGNLRNIVSKVRAVPVQIVYDVEILLATQGDAEKAHQKILDGLFNWKFFRLEYYGLHIDAVFSLPDDQSIENISPDSVDFGQEERYPKIKFTLNVRSYYPIFKINLDDLQVCENDDDIDWERMGVPQPEEDYIATIDKYKNIIDPDNIEQISPNENGEINGSIEDIQKVLGANSRGINWNEAFVKKVFWNGYIYEVKKNEDGLINLGSNTLSDDVKDRDKQKPTIPPTTSPDGDVQIPPGTSC